MSFPGAAHAANRESMPTTMRVALDPRFRPSAGPGMTGMTTMVFTRQFRDSVQARARRDKPFRVALFREAMQCLLEGDVDTGKSALRVFINATVGFEGLSAVTGTPAKSLMRMFGPRGNPQARNLLAVVRHLREATGVRVEVKAA